jgi:hypothetical protein
MTDVIFRDVDAAVLQQLAVLMQPVQPEVLTPQWTAELAEVLIRDLGTAARRLLRESALAGGRIDAAALRGREGDQTLKGLTGPITKAMVRLKKSGKLPEGLPTPVRAEYDPAVRAWQRTIAFYMPAELVPPFKAAFERIDDWGQQCLPPHDGLKRGSSAVCCRIEPYLDQGGACGAAARRQRRRSALAARAAHAGPTAWTRWVTRLTRQASRQYAAIFLASRLSKSRLPRQGRASRVACDRRSADP